MKGIAVQKFLFVGTVFLVGVLVFIYYDGRQSRYRVPLPLGTTEKRYESRSTSLQSPSKYLRLFHRGGSREREGGLHSSGREKQNPSILVVCYPTLLTP